MWIIHGNISFILLVFLFEVFSLSSRLCNAYQLAWRDSGFRGKKITSLFNHRLIDRSLRISIEQSIVLIAFSWISNVIISSAIRTFAATSVCGCVCVRRYWCETLTYRRIDSSSVFSWCLDKVDEKRRITMRTAAEYKCNRSLCRSFDRNEQCKALDQTIEHARHQTLQSQIAVAAIKAHERTLSRSKTHT